MQSIREKIKTVVQNISPIDVLESEHIKDVCKWIDSGAELFRISKPANPPKHLVSYFLLIDGEYILLVDHIKAQKWLPTGGHVDPGENPKNTVKREVQEELNIPAEFIQEEPLMVTTTETVGLTAGHTDVSLWYILKGDRHQSLDFDHSEFSSIKWFHIDDAPYDNTEPHLKRMVQKLKILSANNLTA